MYDEKSSPPTPLSPFSIGLAIGAHVLLFLCLWGGALIFRHNRDVVIPIDMTIVLNENLDKEPDDLDPSKEPESVEKPPEPKPEPKPVEKPPEPEPEPEPEVKKPEPVKQDAVETEKPKPKKVVKKTFEKGRLVKSEKPKKTKPKKFEKGKLVKDSKPKTDFEKLRPARAGNGPRTDKKMSAAEIAKWLALGAREGTKNQLPENELSRCFGLIKNRFYEAWNQPPWLDSLKEAHLEISFTRSGAIRGFKLVKSTGNAEADRSILAAASRVSSVPGLSADFLRKYPVIKVEFKVTRE